MTHNTKPSAQPVSDGEVKKQVDEVKRALIIPLKEYEALSNIVFTDFHGQEEGADPKFDKNYKRYQEADKKLWQSIKNLLAQSYQSGYAAAVGDAVGASPEKRSVEYKGRVDGMGYQPYMESTEAAAQANAGWNTAIDHYRTAIESLGNKG